ncbi:29220_t:CDS:2 [Gigaspora margarita]|uniref:29220_t:CDS:1 n=1 Tax=Gigaspora margarita TaxID=4874 RepID=A0ABN7UIH9_GIGMA|nr:29220_t:CDS:2 [Gigaspora margarita]
MAEIHKYLYEPNIYYKEKNRSFHYTIIEKGIYLLEYKYTFAQHYKIPDKYEIETTWGRSHNRHTVKYAINYIDNKPTFYIYFGDSFKNQIISKKSTNNAATLFHNKVTTLKSTQTSGLVSEASSSTLTKRARKFATQIYNNFQTCSNEHYNQLDVPNLESLQYSVNTNFYTIEYSNQNKENRKQRAMFFVQVMDQNLISQEAYRNLTALEYNLLREYIVSNTKIQIDDEMQKLIPIKLINIKTGFKVNLSENEQPDIDNSDIIEQVTNAIGKAGYRSIKDILNYIMPFLINQNILNPTNPSINLRILGDGRNVGRKIKHVMVTCTILDNKTNLYFPNHHYVVVLYPRSKNYNSLKNAMSLF